jgi:hypothetical protein
MECRVGHFGLTAPIILAGFFGSIFCHDVE